MRVSSLTPGGSSPGLLTAGVAGGHRAVHLPRPIGLALQDSHQLAAAGKHLPGSARPRARAKSAPLERVVSRDDRLLEVEHVLQGSSWLAIALAGSSISALAPRPRTMEPCVIRTKSSVHCEISASTSLDSTASTSCWLRASMERRFSSRRGEPEVQAPTAAKVGSRQPAGLLHAVSAGVTNCMWPPTSRRGRGWWRSRSCSLPLLTA